MFTLTPQAAIQVRRSIQQGDHGGLALRIAASRMPDGGIDYRMGFDEIGEQDTHVTSEGIDIVIAKPDLMLLNGAVMDFVEIEPGQFQFIFMNPNDSHYTPPDQP
ncbi:MAG: iron-sulfur cluster assembly accessory protein [Gammaproteobacteria bacterium]